MVELIEGLGQLIAVVCYARRTVIHTCLSHRSGVFRNLLNQRDLLLVQLHSAGSRYCQLKSLLFGPPYYTAYACVRVLYEWSCVAVEVN